MLPIASFFSCPSSKFIKGATDNFPHISNFVYQAPPFPPPISVDIERAREALEPHKLNQLIIKLSVILVHIFLTAEPERQSHSAPDGPKAMQKFFNEITTRMVGSNEGIKYTLFAG